MGIRDALILALLIIPAVAAQVTIGQYTAALVVEPVQPTVGQPATLRITIRGADGQTVPEFTAKVHMFYEAARGQDELIYRLDGTYPTSDLLIPYQFSQPGEHWVVIDIPGVDAVQDGTLGFEVLPQRIETPRTEQDQLWLVISIALMALIAGLYWRSTRRT